MPPVSLPEEVRAACAWVAERARFVRIDEARIAEYAQGLAGPEPQSEGNPRQDPEAAAAFAICMNAINFGSGWWPTIRKRPGHSGYATMEAGLRERFDDPGPWHPEELLALDAATVAKVLGQDPAHPLMPQFAAALRDVGEHLLADHGGRYLGVVEGTDSIPALAATFASWDSFADVSRYEDRDVPFFKRAQLAAADLHRAGVADLTGAEELTAFADNLVPHVLRVDSVLQLDPSLTERIEAEDLLAHGSPQEVELRACAVQTIERLAAASALTAAEVDDVLWNRGRGRRYKSLPRPRARNTAY
jgi:Potential Queuosine, Q, salvage protein family